MQPVDTLQPLTTPTSEPSQPSKKRILIIAAIIAAVVAVGVGAYFVWNAMQSQVTDAPEPARVTITSSGYTPQTVKVGKGQAVTWTNGDAALHQIVADEAASTLNSGDALQQGETFTYTFSEAGTFTYHDGTDTSDVFTGTVIVE